MAPTKRSRPSFSPPRPSKPMTVSTASKGRDAIYKNQKNAAIAKKRAGGSAKKDTGRTSNTRITESANKRRRPKRMFDEDNEDNDDSEGFEDEGRSALALIDMQAGDDSDEQDDEEEEDDENDEDEEEDSRVSKRHSNAQQNSSPEPDMILAEITTTNEPSDTAIPAKLVHRLLAHHFERGEKTKISTDARDLVSRYLEVFVREAIMRSAYEKDGKEQSGGSGTINGGGFLEVEDLERAAVQLCLDF